MRDFINKIYKNHSLIYKVLLFIATTFLIVYLFPKSGKFKYSFEKGKPWQSEDLQAPFDFAIKKTDEEIEFEKKEVIDNAFIYFDINAQVEISAVKNYDNQFNSSFSDSISSLDKALLFQVEKKF